METGPRLIVSSDRLDKPRLEPSSLVYKTFSLLYNSTAARAPGASTCDCVMFILERRPDLRIRGEIPVSQIWKVVLETTCRTRLNIHVYQSPLIITELFQQNLKTFPISRHVTFIRSWWRCTFWMMSLMTLNQHKNKRYIIIASLKSVQQWVNW